MKVFIVSLLVLVTLTISAQWTYLGEVGFTNCNYTTRNHLRINPITQEPYVIYRGVRAHVMRFDGKEWVLVGKPGFSDGDFSCPSISFDPFGTPYVIFGDIPNKYSATVMKFENDEWKVVGSKGITGVPASFTKIEFNSKGVPYISFMEGQEKDWRASVMRFNGNEWEFVGSRAFTDRKAMWISLAFDKNDIPFLAYQEYDENYNLITTVSRFNGQKWERVGKPGFAGWAAHLNQSLVFDSKNRPYIVCTISGVTTAVRFENGDWKEIGMKAPNVGGCEFATIAIDSKDVPYVAFQDQATKKKISVIKCVNGKWDFVGEQGCSPGSAMYIAMDLDKNDNIYLFFSDGTAEAEHFKGSAMVFKNPTVSVPEKETATDSFLVYPNPAKDRISISYMSNSSEPVTIKMITQLGSVVFSKSCNAGQIRETLDLSGLPGGIYFVELKGETREVKRIVVD